MVEYVPPSQSGIAYSSGHRLLPRHWRILAGARYCGCVRRVGHLKVRCRQLDGLTAGDSPQPGPLHSPLAGAVLAVSRFSWSCYSRSSVSASSFLPDLAVLLRLRALADRTDVPEQSLLPGFNRVQHNHCCACTSPIHEGNRSVGWVLPRHEVWYSAFGWSGLPIPPLKGLGG